MANPSTGFGGAGTEVIRRGYLDGTAESEATLLTGVANHIMTVLSVIVKEVGGLTDSHFVMYLDYDLGGSDLYLAYQHVAAEQTFVWSDRFAITETDKLHFKGSSVASTAAYDVLITYIDQQLA